MASHILHVVSNVSHFNDPTQRTGLWLSELTHAFDIFFAEGFEQCLVSPLGGMSPLDPRSLEWPNADVSVERWLRNSGLMSLLVNTASPQEIDARDFDVIYFIGGHAAMYDYPDSVGLQRIARDIYEQGGIVASVCHGCCGLLNTRLSDGSLLVSGKHLTGFSWLEEVLAGAAKKVPYNAEGEMKSQGAIYEKALLPFISKVVVDGRLVTGQNPRSAKATAEKIVNLLEGMVVNVGLKGFRY